jgi:hypothetical protein
MTSRTCFVMSTNSWLCPVWSVIVSRNDFIDVSSRVFGREAARAPVRPARVPPSFSRREDPGRTRRA